MRTHDGYLARFSLIHARKLQLDASWDPAGWGRYSECCEGRARAGCGPAVRHSSPPASGSRGPASARRPMSQRWLWTPGELWRLSVTGAAPSIARTALYFADAAGARAAQCDRTARRVRRRRHRGGLAAGACPPGPPALMPRRATASARKSGRPKSTRSDDTSYFAPAVSRQISVLTG